MRKWVGTLPVVLIVALAVAASSKVSTTTTPHAGAEPAARAAATPKADTRRTAKTRTTTGRLLADDSHVTAAAPAKSVSTGSLPAADLRVSPMGNAPDVNANVDPGSSVRTAFVVANRSADLRLTVHFAAVDANAKPGGRVEYATRASAGGPATWLTLSDVVATLEPGAKLQVSVTIAPPANAQPGHDAAGVVVRVDRAERASDGNAVKGSLTATLPVVIDVKGAATPLVSIEQVRAAKDGTRDVLAITFQNGGATPNTMVGHVQVLGAHPHTSALRASVGALTRTIVRVPFAKPSGKATVPVSVDAQDANGNAASWSGAVSLAATAPSRVSKSHAGAANHAATSLHRLATTIASRERSLPTLLLTLVALAFLAAAVWFMIELRRSRKRRRTIKAGTAAPTPAPPATARAVVLSAPGPAVAPAPLSPVAPARGRALVHAAGRAIAPVARVPVLDEAVPDSPVRSDQLDAVAAQLRVLVDAIDRLSGSLGVAASNGAPPVAPSPSLAAEPPDALLYAPAASNREPWGASGSHDDADDEYDWPMQAQLEQLVARRREMGPGS